MIKAFYSFLLKFNQATFMNILPQSWLIKNENSILWQDSGFTVQLPGCASVELSVLSYQTHTEASPIVKLGNTSSHNQTGQRHLSIETGFWTRVSKYFSWQGWTILLNVSYMSVFCLTALLLLKVLSSILLSTRKYILKTLL